jgi:hypothetical protein
VRRLLILAALPVLVWSAGIAAAGAECADGTVKVAVAHPALETRICRAAEAGLAQLRRCGLGLDAPVRIEVAASLENPHPGCLGRFDCATGVIQLLSPAAVQAELTATSVLASIDSDALYDSLVAHELAHAAFYQASALQTPSIAAQEYVAYAIQLGVLTKADRDRFLARAGEAAPEDLTELSPVILGLSPDGFAARVWLHFANPGNGCGFLAKLVDGRERLFFRSY